MDLKSKFMDLARISIMEFSLNHPGHELAAKLLSRFYDVDELAINRAYEKFGNLYQPILDLIHYEFTGGRNGIYTEPEWLKEPDED